MLHADKKSKDKWKDFELPFPREDKKSDKDKGGVKGLPDELKKYVYKED